MKPLGAWFLERTWSGELGVQVKKQSKRLGDRRARPPLLGVPPISWTPRAATDVLLPPIYTYVPQKINNIPKATRNASYCRNSMTKPLPLPWRYARTNQPDRPPGGRDWTSDKAEHPHRKDKEMLRTHDLHHYLNAHAGSTRPIYGTRTYPPEERDNYQAWLDRNDRARELWKARMTNDLR